MPRGNGETAGRNLRLDRLKIWLIGWMGYWVIQIVSWTIRWKSEGDCYLEDIYKSGTRAIFTFWHGRIFPATYYWRHRGIVVMTSRNRDGEAIAQCIQRFGYGAARGSSSRGGSRALAQMIREIRTGAGSTRGAVAKALNTLCNG